MDFRKFFRSEADDLATWAAARQVAKSLDRMGVTVTMDSLRKAVPGLDYDVVRRVAKAQPDAVQILDDAKGTLIFPGGRRKEKLRTQLVKAALQEPVREPTPPPPAEEEQGDVQEEGDVLDVLKRQSWYENQVMHVERVEAREASYGVLQTPLPFEVGKRLYGHQAKAVEASLQGKDVSLCTGTASGKSLAYTIPTLKAALERPRACVALWLFPTKALAQDQLAAARRAIGDLNVTVATLDGDTPHSDRSLIAKDPPSIVITNPDMLHYSVLPGATSTWSRLVEDLEIVVVDEAHVYVGAFGSHVAAVLRRLARLRRRPRFFCCSATISNPRDHATRLLPGARDENLVVVDEDGSPRAYKTVVIWNPPLRKVDKVHQRASWRQKPPVIHEDALVESTDDAALTTDERHRFREMERGRRVLLRAMNASEEDFPKRTSSIYEMARLFATLTKKKVRTLAFARTRKLVELVLGYARDLVPDDVKPLIAAYRGGYDKSERRAIEAGLFGGNLRGVVATNALELGVDVGDLDATLHLGHPGSIASLWQQAGRAGRRGDSIAIVVCWDSPIDQLFARCGSELLKRGVEAAALDNSNECVMREHLLCAASEQPLDDVDDRKLFGNNFDACVCDLATTGDLVQCCNNKRWTAHPLASRSCVQRVNLRLIDPVTFEVKLKGDDRVLDTVPYSRAFFELFEGAIYLHQARPHLIVKLDLVTNEAWAQPMSTCNYYTSSRNHTDADPTKRLETANGVTTGCVHVKTEIWGYRKICRKTGRVLSLHEFSLPSLEFDTRGTWIDVPEDSLKRLDECGRDRLSGIHALNHALCIVAPLFVVCDPNDINTEHAYPFQHRPRPPRVIVFDARPGGIGVADKLFQRIDAVLAHAWTVLKDCPCQSDAGCPACLHHSGCTAYNVVLDSTAAALILESLLPRHHKDHPSSPIATRNHPADDASSPLATRKHRADDHPDKITPRRKRRATAVRQAGAMLMHHVNDPNDLLKRRAVRVREAWAPCVPDFRSDFEHPAESS